jgi:hypothetical protein
MCFSLRLRNHSERGCDLYPCSSPHRLGLPYSPTWWNTEPRIATIASTIDPIVGSHPTIKPQQQPPWALRAASVIDNALEPMEDQIGVLDLETADVSPVLRDCTRTASRPLNNPIISRRALDEAIPSFRQLAQPPPFVSVATTHAPTTVVSASHRWSNASTSSRALTVPLNRTAFSK